MDKNAVSRKLSLKNLRTKILGTKQSKILLEASDHAVPTKSRRTTLERSFSEPSPIPRLRRYPVEEEEEKQYRQEERKVRKSLSDSNLCTIPIDITEQPTQEPNQESTQEDCNEEPLYANFEPTLESTLFDSWLTKEIEQLSVTLTEATCSVPLSVYPAGATLDRVELDYKTGRMYLYQGQEDIISLHFGLQISTNKA